MEERTNRNELRTASDGTPEFIPHLLLFLAAKRIPLTKSTENTPQVHFCRGRGEYGPKHTHDKEQNLIADRSQTRTVIINSYFPGPLPLIDTRNP